MVLVGPSLGAAVAIDFLTNHPEAVNYSMILVQFCFYEFDLSVLISPLSFLKIFAGQQINNDRCKCICRRHW